MLTPIHCWRATLAGSRAESAISSRKGVSLRMSARMRQRPQGSLRVCQSGGSSKPSTGASRRSNQPEGASKKAKPMAKATWGRASSGESRRRSSPIQRLSSPWASSRAVKSRAPRVEALAIQRLRPAECQSPGWASNRRRLFWATPSASRSSRPTASGAASSRPHSQSKGRRQARGFMDGCSWISGRSAGPRPLPAAAASWGEVRPPP